MQTPRSRRARANAKFQQKQLRKPFLAKKGYARGQLARYVYPKRSIMNSSFYFISSSLTDHEIESIIENCRPKPKRSSKANLAL